MVLSQALQAAEGTSPGQNGHSPDTGGYSPERAHPLMIQNQADPGKYDSYLATVRHMVNPEMRTLQDYVRSGYYRTDLLRELAHRYYYHTQWQIRSQASMLNHLSIELLKEKAWLDQLLLGLKVTCDPAEVKAMAEGPRKELMETRLTYDIHTLEDKTRPLTAILPMTLADSYDRIDDITSEVQSLALRIRRAQARGIYYDVGPLLAYWRTPYADRGDLDPTLGPGFMVRLNDIIDITAADVWRRQARGVISQTPEDPAAKEYREPTPADDGSGKKRSMLGRIMRR